MGHFDFLLNILVDMTIAAYDFDGTITKNDTFVGLAFYSKGCLYAVMAFLLYSPLIAASILKLYSNSKVKQKVFAFLFRGMSRKDFDNLCERYCESKFNGITRQTAYDDIKQRISNGEKVVIVSASLSNWVLPFARKMGVEDVLCTEAEFDGNDVLTGNFATDNCYGMEKVRRLKKKYPDRQKFKLVAYGDSSGDREMLDFADEGFNRHFQ